MTTRIPHVEYRFEADGILWYVRHVRLKEALCAPFDADLHLITRAEISTSGVLGMHGVLTMSRGEQERAFRGVITAADVRSAGRDVVAFVRFESPLATLRRRRAYRIFQDCTALDICRELVGRVGALADGVELAVSADTAGAFLHREFAVQYDESDLDFMRRLLEDEGRAWFVSEDHTASTLHIIEGSSAFAVPPGTDGEFPILEDQYDEAAQESVQALAVRVEPPVASVVERAWAWQDATELAEGRWDATDTKADPAPALDAVQYEFHHLRRGATPDVGPSARREYERLDAHRYRGGGRSNATAFAPGTRVVIVTPPGVEIEVLVTEVDHVGDAPQVALGDAGSGPNYTNTFECHPLEVPYRPQRTTPRPRIHSLHTAVVTGPPGEEIHTDEHGRIKVRMHWDRSAGPDEDASCWLRVAHSWAGNGWGSSFIPRVGMEVLVAFLDGDPDRPLCVGCVYNGAHRTPYAMPDEKTKSTIRTQSSPGGDGYNELTFEDAAGAEQVYLRAQRDLSTQVLRDETRVVGANQTIRVVDHQRISVGGDQQVAVDGNQTLTVAGGGKDGLAGSSVQVKGELSVAVTEPGKIVLSAAESIELVVGKTKIVLDEQSIQFLAGAGAIGSMSEAIILLPKGGALARLASTVTLQSASGASVLLDAMSARMNSPLGARVFLDDTATFASGVEGESLHLGRGATLTSATIGLEAGEGAQVQLGANALIEGGEVRSSSANGSLALDGGGAKLDGTKVDVTALTTATVLAAMVKIN